MQPSQLELRPPPPAAPFRPVHAARSPGVQATVTVAVVFSLGAPPVVVVVEVVAAVVSGAAASSADIVMPVNAPEASCPML